MKIRLAMAGVMLAALMGACSHNSSRAEETAKPEGMTEFKAAGPVEYANNAQDIAPDPNLPIVIDFNATWCGPCRRFAPIFEETARELKGRARFMSIDVDNSPLAARQFGVSSIPQVSVLMPDGSVRSTVGYMDKAAFMEFLGLEK